MDFSFNYCGHTIKVEGNTVYSVKDGKHTTAGWYVMHSDGIGQAIKEIMEEIEDLEGNWN